MNKSITQDMAYRQSPMKYAEKYGVSRAGRKYNKSRSYIYFWKARWDGTVESLACRSRRARSHPNQHIEAELKLIRDMRHRGIREECVQTDNGFEFTNRFSGNKRDLPPLFEVTAAQLGIRHKLTRPYTPRHNGKVKRSHREEQKRFYFSLAFFSLDDFAKQLAVHNRHSNNFPMRPLHWLSLLNSLSNMFDNPDNPTVKI